MHLKINDKEIKIMKKNDLLKKLTLTMVTGIAAASLLTGCGASGDTAAGGVSDKESGETTDIEQPSETTSDNADDKDDGQQLVVPYTYEDGVLTIYYTEEVIDKDEEWQVYSKEARKVVLSEGIYEISMSTFEGWTNLEEIVLPDSLVTLGWNAFKDCVKLNNVVLPESVNGVSWYAFYGCTALTNITLSSKTLCIDQHAFGNCTSLEDIVLPSTVNRVAEFAFENCPVDAKINLPLTIMKRQPVDKNWVKNMINLLINDDFKQVEQEMSKLDANKLKDLQYYGTVYKSTDETKLGIRIRNNEDGTYWWAVYYVANDEHWKADVIGYKDKYYASDGTYCNGNEAFGPGMLSPWKLDENNDIWLIWGV